MTIILVEENAGGGQKPERSYNKGVVIVGRDADECDIAFDKERWPMVSRRHAEFRCENGTWYIADLNSSYGVFLNGQKISGSQAISVGGSVRLGTDGPVLIIIWFEIGPDLPQATPAFATPIVTTPPPQQYAVQPSPRQPDPVAQQQTAEPRAAQSGTLEFVGMGSRKPFIINQSQIWIGRDPECAIAFESSAGMVSRKHAGIRIDAGEFLLEDNKSFNGTLINEQRISVATPIYHGDEIRLGVGGPVLRFNSPGRIPPKGASLAGQRAVAANYTGNLAEVPGSRTMVLNRETAEKYIPAKSPAQAQLLMSIPFGDKNELTIGRDDGSDIRLDGLQISKRHARLLKKGDGIAVEDLKSTNGVFINGKRVSREVIKPNDAVQIGSFLIGVDAAGNINVFDTRSKTRIDAVNITRQVKDRTAGGQLTLLDSISLSIQPNEFIGILGPSGAGKSMLMNVMNGMRPADSGSVLVNNLDLYRHLDSLKQSIGYVPQEDIIHRELTVYRTLYYVAKLRLSRDVTANEIKQIVDEVLDVTGLAERRDVYIRRLSGGQRKRVSIAVELITKPSIIFLDEPTSGLDPAAEERIMKLFRQIAESGRTVVLTTHAMENVKLFDKIVVLLGGKLVFYGKPDEALTHLHAANFKELYDRLEQPVKDGVSEHGESHRRRITEQTAEEWKKKFLATPQFYNNVQKPLNELDSIIPAGKQKKRRLGLFGGLSQSMTLSRRYFEVLLKDKLTLLILLAQAPVIALMTFFVMGAEQPRDFVYFVLALVAVWFGTSVSAREIVRERPVYERERMVNLGLLPYLTSKLFVLGVIVSVQCLMLFVPLKLFDLVGLMPMPGEMLGIPQFWTMLLTASVGIGVGLLISALVRTSEMATSLIPLILIPQILFSGLVGVPNGVNKVVSMTMPAAWSFDTMKRFSTLDTLEPEGAKAKGKTKGLGLYKYIESENERIIAKAKEDFEDYKRVTGNRYDDNPSDSPTLPDITSSTNSIKKVPDDLSGYVTFLHPWMDDVFNQMVLVLMFGMMVIATLIVLRLKDN